MARHPGRRAPYWAARYLIGCAQRWARYIRGRLLIRGINLDMIEDIADFLDLVLVVVTDMMREGLIVPVADEPRRPQPPRQTFIPLDRFLEDIARGPAGVGINRETWGQDVSDEPPPAEMRSPPEQG